MTDRMNVESFNLDHTKVRAPYVRVADRKTLGAGVHLTKFDVRFCQPNLVALAMPTVHSLEHLMAENIRNHTDRVIDLSPMGCQTGFYVIMEGEWDPEAFLDVLVATMEDVLQATEVPAANEVQCGWGANHDLYGAQQSIRQFLSHEWDDLLKVFS